MADTIVTRIYALIDPRDGAIFYVGRTTMTLNARLTNHVRDGRKRRSPKGERISLILETGLRPQIVELISIVDATVEIAEKAEQAWIDFYNITQPLTNVASAKSGGNPSQQRIIWNFDIQERLGKDSDRAIAIELGCSYSTVTNYRNKLGILRPPHTDKGKQKSNRIQLPQWVIDKLGTMPDAELGKLSGFNHQKIFKERKLRGISAIPQWEITYKNYPSHIIERMGKVPDSVLASELKITPEAICKARKLRNIPSWRAKFKQVQLDVAN